MSSVVKGLDLLIGSDDLGGGRGSDVLGPGVDEGRSEDGGAQEMGRAVDGEAHAAAALGGGQARAVVSRVALHGELRVGVSDQLYFMASVVVVVVFEEQSVTTSGQEHNRGNWQSLLSDVRLSTYG